MPRESAQEMTTTTLPATETDERTDARVLTLPLVAAQVAQNVFGGLLLGNAVAALMWLAGADLALWWRWPVGIGWFIAGLGGIRAFADEFRAGRRWSKREAQHADEMRTMVALTDRLEEERGAAWAQLAAVTHERDRLQAENASLSYEWRKAKATPRTVLVEDLIEPQAKQDARHLVRLWAMHGKRPSRADVVPAQMTRARFDAAYSELIGAHIIGADTMTEAQMLHALDVRWSAPFPVSDGKPGAPTSSAGWAARLPAQH